MIRFGFSSLRFCKVTVALLLLLFSQLLSFVSQLLPPCFNRIEFVVAESYTELLDSKNNV